MSAFDRLALVPKICPNAYSGVEIFARAKHDKESEIYSWPDWCFLPMSAWIAIASSGRENEERMTILDRVYQIAAPATWRYTQGIYEFDPDIYTELMESDFMGKIPCEALLRLPEWCIYIKTPLFKDGDSDVDGLFAMLEYDTNTGSKELRLFIDRKGNRALSPLILYLVDGNTIEDSIRELLAESVQNSKRLGFTDQHIQEQIKNAQDMSSLLKRLLPLVLYLCTDKPEIENLTTPDWLPHNPQPKNIRGEFRLMPAKKPHHYMLGQKTGIQLRQARRRAALEGGHDGRTISPHIRKAHWHGYWTGPRKGKDSAKQQFVLKWIPTIIVLGSQKNSSS